MALDLMDRLADECLNFIKTKNLKGFSSLQEINVDVMPAADVAVVFQYAPSTGPTRYFDRTSQQDLNVMIKVKNPMQIDAINAILDIFEHYEKLDTLASSNDSFEFVSAGIYTFPTLIDKTDKSNYIYAGMISVSVYIN